MNAALQGAIAFAVVGIGLLAITIAAWLILGILRIN